MKNTQIKAGAKINKIKIKNIKRLKTPLKPILNIMKGIEKQ